MVSIPSFRASLAKLLGREVTDPAVSRIVHLRGMADMDPDFRRRWLSGELDDDGDPMPRNPLAVETAFERLLRTERTALFLERVERQTRSHIGGSPDLPPDLNWPSPVGSPLAFLAQLDCAELPRVAALDWLPSTGTLFFFLAPGDGMTYAGRSSTSAVLFSPNQGASYVDPPIAPIGPRRFLVFQSLPTFESSAKFNQPGVIHPQDQDDLFGRLIRLEAGRPFLEDQIGGWASPLQIHDMPLECEQVASGLQSDDPEYQQKYQEWRSRGDLGWRLLLRLDLSAMPEWLTDSGGSHVYFWIREEDARRCDFNGGILLVEAD